MKNEDRSLMSALKAGALDVLGEVTKQVVAPVSGNPERWLAQGNHAQAQRLMALGRLREPRNA